MSSLILNQDGKTALRQALTYDHVEVVKELLKVEEIDVNARRREVLLADVTANPCVLLVMGCCALYYHWEVCDDNICVHCACCLMHHLLQVVMMCYDHAGYNLVRLMYV